MPVNPVVPQTAQLRVHFTLPNSEEMVNVYHFDIGAGPFIEGDANAIANAVHQAAWVAELQPVISDTVTLNQYDVLDLRTYPYAGFSPVNSAVGGEGGSNPLPFQVAGVLKWITGIRGRNYRGRTYLGGFCENGSAGQSPEAAVLTAINDFGAAMIANAGVEGFPMVVVSRYVRATPPATGSVPRVTNITTPITAASADLAWHTHRTRALRG